MTDDLPGKITWFKYVPHSMVAVFRLVGWEVDADLGPTHGHYSVLMRYVKPCGDRPPMPTGNVKIQPRAGAAMRTVKRAVH